MELFKGSGQNSRLEPIREKNYFFVYRNELPRIDLSRLSPTKQYFGKLYLTITALQQIFIGCGHIERHQDQLYDAFSHIIQDPQQKTLTIPGSSLKGSVLTNLNLFLHPGSTHFMGSHEAASRVLFCDCPLANAPEVSFRTIAARFSPRDKVIPLEAEIKLYRKDDPAYGPLTDQEILSLPATERIGVLEAGSRFNGSLHFKSLDEYQLTFLILALGCLGGHRFAFKIGGAKNRAMGLVQVEIDSDRSFYAESLSEIAEGKQENFKTLEPRLLETISTIKKQFGQVETLLNKIQGEYNP